MLKGTSVPRLLEDTHGKAAGSRLTLFLLVNDVEWIHRSSFLEELSLFPEQLQVSECSARQPQASYHIALYTVPRPGGH